MSQQQRRWRVHRIKRGQVGDARAARKAKRLPPLRWTFVIELWCCPVGSNGAWDWYQVAGSYATAREARRDAARWYGPEFEMKPKRKDAQ